jgi:DNA polymerase
MRSKSLQALSPKTESNNMPTLWFDCETFSECDLKAHGTHRYAEHLSTEITVAQWAIGDGEPEVADMTTFDTDCLPVILRKMLNDPTVTVIAHNSAFDRTLLRNCWGVDVPIERWQDTMIQAMAHGLPGGLDKIGQIVGLEADLAKDKRGRELIQLFCKPRPKNSTLRRATRESHPKEWAEFLEYSRQDIVAMRAIGTRLPTWNFRAGHTELDLWHLDQRINDRGVAVDLALADAAIDAVAIEQKRLKAAVHEATDGLVHNASKRDQLLAFICAEYGVNLPDMKADTLRRRIEDPDLPEGVKLLLSIRLEATKTSTAKYKALVNATSADGRLRNTLQFAGAQRTARWAGRIFQPQNLPRPDVGHMADHFGVTVKNLTDELKEEYEHQAIESLKGGYPDVVFTDVMQLTTNAIRGCIVAPPGKKLVISDLSNIEGRGLAFLAGERWKLKAFAEFDAGTGEDLYKVAYGRSFNIDPKEATGQKRQIGKVMELGLGYEGGVAAFLTFAAVYQMDLEDLAKAVYATASNEAMENALGMWKWAKSKKRTLGLPENIYVACEILKRAWRDAHPQTCALWKAAGDSVRAAIANPGETFPIGDHLKARRDGAWLRIRLPSGRYLCYINPKVDDDGQITYFGVNQYTRQWGAIKTYGGKLIENCTQAFARDILASSMPGIELLGYQIVLSVHDELLTETPDTDEFSVEQLSALMSEAPHWAKGIPLAAAGFETYRYRKD